MYVHSDRLLFMFNLHILIFCKSYSFYRPTFKTRKMTEVPALQPFFQCYGWTLWNDSSLDKMVFVGRKPTFVVCEKKGAIQLVKLQRLGRILHVNSFPPTIPTPRNCSCFLSSAGVFFFKNQIFLENYFRNTT